MAQAIKSATPSKPLQKVRVIYQSRTLQALAIKSDKPRETWQ